MILCPKCKSSKDLVVYYYGYAVLRAPVGEDGFISPAFEVFRDAPKGEVVVSYSDTDRDTSLTILPLDVLSLDPCEGEYKPHILCKKCQSKLFDLPETIEKIQCPDVE